MDKATLIARYAEQDTDKIVLARLLDRMQMGKQRNIPTSTAFLSDREQVLAQQLLAQGVPVGEAALRCGYQEYSTFSRAYRKQFQRSPSSR